MYQPAAKFRAARLITTLPLISAAALTILMLTAADLLAALAPSRTAGAASPTAPVALADRAPVTLSLPFSAGVRDRQQILVAGRTDRTRDALQPIIAFCNTWDAGLSGLGRRNCAACCARPMSRSR